MMDDAEGIDGLNSPNTSQFLSSSEPTPKPDMTPCPGGMDRTGGGGSSVI